MIPIHRAKGNNPFRSWQHFKSTTNSIAVSGRRERAMFEVWLLQETLDSAISSGPDHSTGCHAIP
ncbi:MAG: hypothetical protein F4073_01910 [Rhodobacteraceae bacterium]|nr:hypothetical protein [Paracoccaceae bacterium]MYF47072.1 hypothetical protein [Paracoccaceae bacterium]MYI90690.1 hypothetical protein [Paracoccaceae bacterium]